MAVAIPKSPPPPPPSPPPFTAQPLPSATPSNDALVIELDPGSQIELASTAARFGGWGCLIEPRLKGVTM